MKISKQAAAILFIIIFFAVILRLGNIASRGLYNADEGTYAMEGKWVLNNNSTLGSQWTYLDWTGGDGKPFTSMKPLFNLITGSVFLLFGDSDTAGIAAVAFLGVLTIILTFLIGRELYSEKAGLIAAAFMAVAEIHVKASTVLLTEAVELFFVALAVLVYLKGKKQETRCLLFFSGVLAALAFEARYTGFFAVVLLLLFEAADAWLFKPSVKKAVKNIAMILTGSALVFFIFWASYAFIGVDYEYTFLSRLHVFSPGKAFIQAVPFLRDHPFVPLEAGGASSSILTGVAVMAYGLAVGMPLLLFPCLAYVAWRMLKHRTSQSDLMVLLWAAFTLAFFLFIEKYYDKRALLAAALPLSLLAGSIVAKSARFSASRVFLLFLAAVMFSGLLAAVVSATFDNHVYRDLASFTVAQGISGGVCVPSPPNLYFYREMQVTTCATGLNVDALSGLHGKGVRYVVIDEEMERQASGTLADYLKSACKEVKAFEIPPDKLKLSSLNAPKRFMRVYDISECK